MHRGSHVFILVCVLCSEDSCLGWILIVLWSFPRTCLFWSLGNVPSLRPASDRGSSQSPDSPTDRRGTCGREIRLKCAGCNQCERASEVKGKVMLLSCRGRGEALVRRCHAHLGPESCRTHGLSHREVKPGKEQKTAYCCLSVSPDSGVH